MNNSKAEDDKVLLRQVIRGNELAFEQIYYRYNRQIYTFALRILRSEILAEEVMHETMLKVWRLGAKGDAIQNLEAYLKTTARNSSLNVLRRIEIEQRAATNQYKNWAEGHQDTEETILLNDARRLLEQAVSLLPPQQQQVFRLCHLEGLKYEEAAERMGISVGTVAVHMKLALRFVRTYMRKATDLLAILVLFRLF